MNRYIDADKLITHKYTEQEASHNDMGGAYRQGWNDAIDAVVGNEPVADVVPMDYHERCLSVEMQKRMNMIEVVRCADCKWFQPINNGDHGCCGTPFHGAEVYEDDYCSDGERANT